TWTEDGRLYEFELQSADQVGQPALPNSRKLQTSWRINSDLPLNSLIGMAEDRLLIAGHDGGFSGMHEASSVYAAERKTGKKLWQVDLDYSFIGYMLSGNEKQ